MDKFIVVRLVVIVGISIASLVAIAVFACIGKLEFLGVLLYSVVPVTIIISSVIAIKFGAE